MVRDWAAEGAQERAQAYGPLLEALKKYMPITKENLRDGWRKIYAIDF